MRMSRNTTSTGPEEIMASPSRKVIAQDAWYPILSTMSESMSHIRSSSSIIRTCGNLTLPLILFYNVWAGQATVFFMVRVGLVYTAPCFSYN